MNRRNGACIQHSAFSIQHSLLGFCHVEQVTGAAGGGRAPRPRGAGDCRAAASASGHATRDLDGRASRQPAERGSRRPALAGGHRAGKEDPAGALRPAGDRARQACRYGPTAEPTEHSREGRPGGPARRSEPAGSAAGAQPLGGGIWHPARAREAGGAGHGPGALRSNAGRCRAACRSSPLYRGDPRLSEPIRAVARPAPSAVPFAEMAAGPQRPAAERGVRHFRPDCLRGYAPAGFSSGCTDSGRGAGSSRPTESRGGACTRSGDTDSGCGPRASAGGQRQRARRDGRDVDLRPYRLRCRAARTPSGPTGPRARRPADGRPTGSGAGGPDA